MCWGTFWAIFSQTLLVTLKLHVGEPHSCPTVSDISFRKSYPLSHAGQVHL
jgi:hypothetical protein